MTRFSFFLAVILILTAYAGHVSAQNPIPNPDFEDWSGGEPVGWNTVNQNIFGTDFICVTRDQSNPQHGNSCVKVETVTQNIFLVGPVTMPGILSLGEITIDIINQTGTVNGGVPISAQPNQLKGYFRYQPAAGDSCILGIGLFRWNGSSRDTLATAYTVIGGQHPNWTEFSVPIEYLIWAVPDTMNIMFFSSNLLNGSPVAGSRLWIDNLILEYGPVETHNPEAAVKPVLQYTSEGLPVITFSGGPTPADISIFGMNGARVMNFTPSPGQQSVTLNTRLLAPGMYLVRIKSNDGSLVAMKFVRF